VNMMFPPFEKFSWGTGGFILKEGRLTTKQAEGSEVRSTIAKKTVGDTLCDVVNRGRARNNHDSALEQHPRMNRATSTWGDHGGACGKIDGQRNLSVITLGRNCRRSAKQDECSSEKKNHLANCIHNPDRRSRDQTHTAIYLHHIR